MLKTGVDDGSENSDMSLRMLRLAQKNGIRQMILTSHNKPMRQIYPQEIWMGLCAKAVLRFALDKTYKAEDVISVGIKVNIAGYFFLSVILFALKNTGIINLDGIYILFLHSSYALGAISNCFTMYLKARNRISVMIAGGLLNTLLSCILNIILLLVIKYGIYGYLIANIAGMAISVIYMFWRGGIYKDIHLKEQKDLGKAMITYSLPLVANSMAWWLNNVSDRYILIFYCGFATNGIYAISYKIPTILSTVQNVFYNAWSISAITEFDENDTDGFIGNTYTAYSCISIIVCSLIMVFNIYIARVLYAKDFFAAWKYVPFLLVGTVFNGIALFEGCIFTAVKKTKDVSIANDINNFYLLF